MGSGPDVGLHGRRPRCLYNPRRCDADFRHVRNREALSITSAKWTRVIFVAISVFFLQILLGECIKNLKFKEQSANILCYLHCLVCRAINTHSIAIKLPRFPPRLAKIYPHFNFRLPAKEIAKQYLANWKVYGQAFITASKKHKVPPSSSVRLKWFLGSRQISTLFDMLYKYIKKRLT